MKSDSVINKIKKIRSKLNWLLHYRRFFITDKFVTPNYALSQYFFTSECVDFLIDNLDKFKNPCCVGTPRLAKGWLDRGRIVRLLDIDNRFSSLPGFICYDISKPKVLDEKFDVIIMDPTFKFGDDVLLKAVNILSHNDYSQKLLLIHATSNTTSILKKFKEYNLRPTGYYPKYSNLRKEGKKIVMCFSNFKFPS